MQVCKQYFMKKQKLKVSLQKKKPFKTCTKWSKF